MALRPAGREAGSGGGLQHYERHRPEHTLLYKLVEEHYPVFAEQMAAQGMPLPRYVQREFEDDLACGRLENGFLRVRCDSCRAEKLVAFSCRRRGLLRAPCPPPFGPAFGCKNCACSMYGEGWQSRLANSPCALVAAMYLRQMANTGYRSHHSNVVP